MQISLASEPAAPGAVNLDWAGATAGTAVVLDGLTEAPQTGCRHGTAWYVRQLGARLLAAVDAGAGLVDALTAALAGVAAAHGGGCDLTHPGSPGATVAAARARPDGVEYLVLADAVVILDAGDEVLAVTDQRVLDHLPELRTAATAGAGPAALGALIEAQTALRNRPGGYPVAQADPGSAATALTGTVPGVRSALLLSDGAALLATDFAAASWRELLDLATAAGPAAVIAATRELEARDADRRVWPRYKASDDATAVLLEIHP
ncbi:MAG TPA: protein phosphatase 2C domain-containing protein [Pilimelia sp.]|nr:protein phosphatase 2C domain-containing protein [Pilimelia sp.]